MDGEKRASRDGASVTGCEDESIGESVRRVGKEGRRQERVLR